MNRRNGGNDGEGGSLADLYGQLFRARGLLPDAVARQDPELLFMMLESLYEDEEPEIPPDLAYFYGL